MVPPRRINLVINMKRHAYTLLFVIGLAFFAPEVSAQNYSPGDTVTLYPLKGTFYANRFVGRKTSSGEVFDQNLFTAAHWKIKLGTYVLVTNENTGKQVIVKVNDRCPRHGVLDMSRRAARAVGIKGCQPVKARLLGPGWKEAWEAQHDNLPSLEELDVQVIGKSYHSSEPVPVEKPKQVVEGQYDLFIGTAATRDDAEQMIKRLPEQYQTKVEPHAEFGTDGVSLILRLGQSHHKVAELQSKLLEQFPEAAIRKAPKDRR